MRKYKGFDTLPSSLRNVAREAIDRYSIQPDTDRLVFPLLINGVARPLLCEVPIDDPSMSMLLVCLCPSRFTKGRFYVSPRQNRLWEAYTKAHPDGFKRPNTYGGGSTVLQIESTLIKLPSLLNRSNVQFHPIANVKTARTSYEPSKVGLINRCTAFEDQSVTSSGCAAVGSFDQVLGSGFNEVHVLSSLQPSVDKTLFELASPRALVNIMGERWFTQQCRHLGTDPNDITIFECGRIVDQCRSIKTGEPLVYVD